MRSGQVPPAVVTSRSPMVAIVTHLRAMGGGGRRYTMRICLLRHPGSIHMRRWIEYLASEGHEVHVLYFEVGSDTIVPGEETLPELAATRNVHLHCIPSRPAFSVAKAAREALAAGSGGREGKTVERPPRRTGLRAAIGRKAGAASLIARHPLSYLEVRLLGRSARRLARRTGAADTGVTVARLRNLRRILRKLKPDVLHAHDAYLYGYMGALSGFHPFVLSAWGSDVLVKPQESPEARNRVALALREADVVTTTAEFLGPHLIEEFELQKERVVRIAWGIDLKVFHRGYEDQAKELRETLGIDADSPVILSNRNLKPPYEIASIVDAIADVVSSCPGVVFVFLRGYGSERYENEMKSRARALGVLQNTRFVSEMASPEEMAAYLNMSLAFVSIPRYGQLGSCILEGMACGAIPIVSDIEVHRTLLTNGENAFLVDTDRPRGLAESIISSIEHSDLREGYYSINKRLVEENEDWDKNAVRMQEMYEGLTRGEK